MAANPDPTKDAKEAFQDSWAAFIAKHNHPQRDSYVGHLPEQSQDTLKSAYEKLLRGATFPEAGTAVIALRDFKTEETNATLLYLDKTGVHSTIEWDHKTNTPTLNIKDKNNTHLAQPPVQTIQSQQERLLASDPAAQNDANKEQLYIPPFNTVQTDKGFYILLEHMHPQDIDSLETALTSRNIPFTEKDSPTCGNVFIVKFNVDHFQEMGKMIKEARTEENQSRAPDHARIYAKRTGCPAINILGADDKYIPLDGMTYPQIMALESRMNDVAIPYKRDSNPDYGSVLAVQSEYEDKLNALSRTLRAEYNATKNVSPINSAPSYQDQQPK